MLIRQKFNLIFEKKRNWFSLYYYCITKSPKQEYAQLASKLSTMSQIECEGLIESMVDAEDGKYYEEFFALDADAASDNDEIHILPPNIIIDKSVTISFSDMKKLLQEWMSFRNK